MFTKLEQRSWIKIEVARGRRTQESFQGLHQALAGTEPQNPIILHESERSHTPAALKHVRRWKMEILEHLPYSHDMSPCNYDLFAKVKEPLRETRYITRDELIRAIERSILNINSNGGADAVRCLSNIWQRVLNKGGDYIEGTCMLYPCEESHVRNIELLPLLFIQHLYVILFIIEGLGAA